MDPLASIREYRDQEATIGKRVVRIAPPPAIPMPPVVNRDDELDDTGELDLTLLSDQPETPTSPYGPETQPGEAEQKMPGTPRGRKRLMQVYLPAPTRALLENGRRAHGTLGAAVMVALRGSYEWIVEHHTPEPVEAVGPFPAPRAPRRRLVVDDARMRPIYVDPDEAAGIETLADQCQLSLSELVTIAIDHHYEC
jgi:hypothetical protein